MYSHQTIEEDDVKCWKRSREDSFAYEEEIPVLVEEHHWKETETFEVGREMRYQKLSLIIGGGLSGVVAGAALALTKHSLNASDIEKEFNALAEKWKKETGAHSATIFIVSNSNYQKIIGLGQDVIQYILRDLNKTNYFWFDALEALLPRGEESPVTDEEFGDFIKTKQAWLAWGKRKDLLS